MNISSDFKQLSPMTLFAMLLLTGCGGGGGGSAIVSPLEAPADTTTGATEPAKPAEVVTTPTTPVNEGEVADGPTVVQTNPETPESTSPALEPPKVAEVVSTPAAQTDDEYNMSWGLKAINADAVHQIGGTGKGQTIAIVDTGIDGTHSEFSGNLLDASYDFQGNTSVMTDPGNHGTHVAGIAAGARDGEGAHGVAYDAKILGMRLLGDGYKSFDEISDMYQYAIDNDAKIINNSWGATGISVDGLTTDNAQALFGNNIAQVGSEVIRNDDAVFVWSAGNDSGQEANIMAGLPYHFPELKDGWVAVVAVNPNGAIAGYSNKCGKSAEWCLAAPGSSIYSAAAGGGYMSNSGASMATPHVSGALAALASAFPNLTNQQILARVLHTANKSGIYADSELYGNGLLDMAAASTPVGDLKMTMGASAEQEAALAASSVVILPKQVLEGMDLEATSTNVLLVDSFQNAPFWASASQYIKEQDAPVLNIEWSSLFNITQEDVNQGMELGADLALSLNHDAKTKEVAGFNLTKDNDSSAFSVGSGSGEAMIDNVLGFSQSQDWVSSSDSSYLATGYQLKDIGSDDNIRINVGVTTKNPLAGQSGSNSLVTSTTGDVESAALGEVAMKVGETSEVSMQVGAGTIDQINNQTTSTGAFGVSNSSLSNISMGVSKKAIGGLVTASLGYDNITSESDSSLIDLPENIGLATAKVDYSVSDNGRHGLQMGATMRRATGDDINVRLPNSIAANGDVGYASFNTDIGNLYNQQALEMTYNYQINKATKLGLQSFYQQNGIETEGDYGLIFGVEVADR